MKQLKNKMKAVYMVFQYLSLAIVFSTGIGFGMFLLLSFALWEWDALSALAIIRAAAVCGVIIFIVMIKDRDCDTSAEIRADIAKCWRGES